MKLSRTFSPKMLKEGQRWDREAAAEKARIERYEAQEAAAAKTRRFNGLATETWREVMWLDLEPGPERVNVRAIDQGFTIQGREIKAKNSWHAKYMWAMAVGAEFQYFFRCGHCEKSMRYLVVAVDAAGVYHLLDESCAVKLGVSCNREEWEQRKLPQTREARDGRYYVKVKASEKAPWLLALPESALPDFAKVKLWKAPWEGREVDWLTIWGEGTCQVLENWEFLLALRNVN